MRLILNASFEHIKGISSHFKFLRYDRRAGPIKIINMFFLACLRGSFKLLMEPFISGWTVRFLAKNLLNNTCIECYGYVTKLISYHNKICFENKPMFILFLIACQNQRA
jgi:hypothetical protein